MTNLRVFVYGSLKRGFSNHGQLAGARFLGAARTGSGYVLYQIGRYPALVRARAGVVSGELFEVNADLLRRLDVFENCPELYRRELVELSDQSRAFSYTMSSAQVRGYGMLAQNSWAGAAIARRTARTGASALPFSGPDSASFGIAHECAAPLARSSD